MANQEHLARLKRGVEAWNQWRRENPNMWLDLSNANLSGQDLTDVNFHQTNLSGADLSGADLYEASFMAANLSSANLSSANLKSAYFTAAILNGTNLSGADLRGARFYGADLIGANLRNAKVYLGSLESDDVDLRGAIMPDGTRHP